MNFLHGYELLDDERERYGRIILQNIFDAFKTLQQEDKQSTKDNSKTGFPTFLYPNLDGGLKSQEMEVYTQFIHGGIYLKLTWRLLLSICGLSILFKV